MLSKSHFRTPEDSKRDDESGAVSSPKEGARQDLDAAQRLLTQALNYLTQNGLKDVSLRSLAPKLGSSHRMMIYYFGSADGFWRALSSKIRRMRQESTMALAESGQLPNLEAIWAIMTSPEQLPFIRLMFELYGKALSDPDANRDFLDDVVSSWLQVLTKSMQHQHGFTVREAEMRARLQLAVLRGLLMDLLSTEDREGTQACLSFYSKLV